MKKRFRDYLELKESWFGMTSEVWKSVWTEKTWENLVFGLLSIRESIPYNLRIDPPNWLAQRINPLLSENQSSIPYYHRIDPLYLDLPKFDFFKENRSLGLGRSILHSIETKSSLKKLDIIFSSTFKCFKHFVRIWLLFKFKFL